MFFCRAYIFAVLAIVTAGFARADQPQLSDQRFFGGSGDERGTGVAVADTGSAYAIYASGSSASLNDEGIVVKYNFAYGAATAVPAWNIAYPGAAGPDQFNGIAATATNAYAAGFSFSRTTDTVGSKEAKGITVNLGASAGAIAWERQTPAAPGAYSYGGFERLNGIASATQSGAPTLYVGGHGQSGFNNGARLFVSRLDGAGGVMWTRTDDNAGAQPASAVYAMAATGTAAFAAGYTDDTGAHATLLRNYDPAGTLTWSRAMTAGVYFGVAADAAAGVVYAVGKTNGTTPDFLIEKWDVSGNRLWSRTFDRSGAEDILAGVTLLNGRIFAAGSTRGGTAGGSDGALLEFDPVNGNLLGTTLWGGVADDSFAGISVSADALHLVGTTASFGAGGTDLAYVIYAVPEPTGLLFAGVGLGLYTCSRRRRVA